MLSHRYCLDNSVMGATELRQIKNKQGLLPHTPKTIQIRSPLSSRQGYLMCGRSSVAVAVPVIVVDLEELRHNLQDVEIVFLQQPQVQLPVTESHFKEMSHQGCCLVFRNYWLCGVKKSRITFSI